MIRDDAVDLEVCRLRSDQCLLNGVLGLSRIERIEPPE